MSDQRKEASEATKLINQQVGDSPMFEDTQSFEDAQNGFVGTWDTLTITNNDGAIAWNMEPHKAYQGIDVDTPPDTVNPSLWRQARLNTLNGLYKVADGFYQVRTFDMSNMTVIEAPQGLIIIDPLISNECAAQALALYRQFRPEHATTPVAAVIYSHSHIDHFGGVRGVVTDDIIDSVEIYAPNGFLEHAVSENVYAGVAMVRRAEYQFGPYLPQDAKGQVDIGLGKGQSVGTNSLIAPTHVITRSVESLTIAGMNVTFQLTPGAEAPAEMNFYFPDQRILCGAENLTQNMHNLQTLRGALVRDPLNWSRYLNEALKLFGNDSDILFNQHHWPIWGNTRVTDFIRRQRDMYRFFNDQSLRMLNKGYTGIELAEVFQMPPGVDQHWSCRGYYGTVSHNSKAVYHRYMGWFNGNPCDLHPLAPDQAAARYVAVMGGPDSVFQAATSAHESGDYRWSAELLKHLVFFDQSNQAFKNLLADSLEQLGYQAEAGTWRNFYLMGAQELRDGVRVPEAVSNSDDLVVAMTNEMILDAFAANLVGPRAADHGMTMLWIFTAGTDTIDPDNVLERRFVEISNGALSHIAVDEGEGDPAVDVTLTLTRYFLDQLLLGNLSAEEILNSDGVEVEGDKIKLIQFFALLEAGDPNFPIVTPRSDAQIAWNGSQLADVASADRTLCRRRKFLLSTPQGC